MQVLTRNGVGFMEFVIPNYQFNFMDTPILTSPRPHACMYTLSCVIAGRTMKDIWTLRFVNDCL